MPPALWLEDFNDPPPQLALPEPEPEPDPLPEVVPNPRLEGWHEGFFAGYRQALLDTGQREPSLIAELTERVLDLEQKLDTIAANSAAQVGALLIDMLQEAVPDDWPHSFRDQLAKVVEAVRPSFHLDPKLFVHVEPPGMLDFQDLPGFARRLEALKSPDWPVTVHWDTETPPAAALPALREAIAPDAQCGQASG